MTNTETQKIYLDCAAAVPLHDEVFLAMEPYLRENFANPSALYRSGVVTRTAIDTSRKTLSEFLHASQSEIIFARGGTESLNMAILGVAGAYERSENKKGHIVTTAIEHASVLESIRHLEKLGWEVTYVEPDESGTVHAEQVMQSITERTILISVMTINNEIGSILPIQTIGRGVLKMKKKNNSQYPLLHTDACQAPQWVDLDVRKSHVDLLSFNGSKIYGPKGIAVLYKRKAVKLAPQFFGGGQEQGLRPGTEPVASIVGLAKAVELIDHAKNDATRVLRDSLYKMLSESVDGVVLNGPPLEKDLRSPNNLNISISGIDAESLVLYLDAVGIEIGTGAACSTEKNSISHVLKSCGYSDERCEQSVRFTLGNQTTEVELKRAVDEVKRVVTLIRKTGSNVKI